MLNGNVLGSEASLYPGIHIQRLAKVCAPGLVNFTTALAYHFCRSLPAAFTQPGASTLADLCTHFRVWPFARPGREGGWRDGHPRAPFLSERGKERRESYGCDGGSIEI